MKCGEPCDTTVRYYAKKHHITIASFDIDLSQKKIIPAQFKVKFTPDQAQHYTDLNSEFRFTTSYSKPEMPF